MFTAIRELSAQLPSGVGQSLAERILNSPEAEGVDPLDDEERMGLIRRGASNFVNPALEIVEQARPSTSLVQGVAAIESAENAIAELDLAPWYNKPQKFAKAWWALTTGAFGAGKQAEAALREVRGDVTLDVPEAENIPEKAVDVVSGLIKIGIQMAINKAFAKANQTENVVSAHIAGPAIASAYAPAAAAVSLATLGANAVPASAGIISTMALAESFALMGMAHDGIDRIPKEGTWLLDKGERVLSSSQNDEIVKAVKNGTGGDIQVTNVFQLGGSPSVEADVMRLLPAIERRIINSVEQAMRGGGSLSRAAGVR